MDTASDGLFSAIPVGVGSTFIVLGLFPGSHTRILAISGAFEAERPILLHPDDIIPA